MSEGTVKSDLVRGNLLAVIDDLGMNPNSFATMVGIDSSNLQKKLKGQLKITVKDLNKLSKVNINTDFIMTGHGDMYVGKVGKPVLDDDPKRGVPVFAEEFSCGFLSFNDTAIRPIGYIDFPGTTGATCWCKATGDSMRPMIENGDYVCFKRLADWKDFLVFGDVYAIDTYNDMRSIKRIEHGESGDEYTLVPVNGDYSSQSLRKEMIRSLFRVIAVTKIF